MLAWLKHYLFGYLSIEMTGFSPERFLNMCSVHEIELWKVVNYGHSYQLFMTVQGFRKVKPLVRKSKVRLRILKKSLDFLFFTQEQKKGNYMLPGL